MRYEYRILAQKNWTSDHSEYDVWLQLCEVYYNDKEIPTHYEIAGLGANTVLEIKATLKQMVLAFQKPILWMDDLSTEYKPSEETIK